MTPHRLGTVIGLVVVGLALLTPAGPATAAPTWPFDRVEVAGTCGTVPGSVTLRARRTGERQVHLRLLATGIANGSWTGEIDLLDATGVSADPFRRQVRRHTVRRGADFVLRRGAHSFSASLRPDSDEVGCGVGGWVLPDGLDISAGLLEVGVQADDGRLYLTAVGRECRSGSEWWLRVVIGARGHEVRRSLGTAACRHGSYRATGAWTRAALPGRVQVVARSGTGEVHRASYRIGNGTSNQ